jgi:glycogen synthase
MRVFFLTLCFLLLQVPYTSENVVEGKTAAKRALQQKLGLQQIDVPIVGIITRLTAQKGIHLIKHAIHRTLESNSQVCLSHVNDELLTYPHKNASFCNSFFVPFKT